MEENTVLHEYVYNWNISRYGDEQLMPWMPVEKVLKPKKVKPTVTLESDMPVKVLTPDYVKALKIEFFTTNHNQTIDQFLKARGISDIPKRKRKQIKFSNVRSAQKKFQRLFFLCTRMNLRLKS